MAKNILCYGGTSGFRVNEIADAVSLHLNFVGTGEGEVNLDDVKEIVVEYADRTHMSQDLDDEFEKLFSAEKIRATFEGDEFNLEKRIKPVIEQVVEPRLDDLSLSQAKLGADLKEQFDAAEKRLFAKSDAGSMEKRLLDAINNKLKP